MIIDFLKKHFLLAILSVISTALYYINYLILGNVRDTASSFIGNLAFLPVYIIVVTVIVEKNMRERERQIMMRKLNMVIGVFFSEVGNRLLKELSAYIVTGDDLRHQLHISAQWSDADFKRALSYLKSDLKIDSLSRNKQQLKDFLVSKRDFLVSLLKNQNLLEHEQFTDLLWAVFHLVEELEARKTLENLSLTDTDHLNGDIKRVFGYLSCEWVLYMKHLKHDYPYLFSLAIRLNPMVDNPDPHVC